MAMYDEQILGARQQAETARKLRESAMGGQSGEMVSGWYVPRIDRSLLDAFKMVLGASQEKAATDKAQELLKQKESATQDWWKSMPTAQGPKVESTYAPSEQTIAAHYLRGQQPETKPQMPMGGPAKQDPSMISAMLRGEQPQQMPMANAPLPQQTGVQVTPATQPTPEQRMQWLMKGQQVNPEAAQFGAKYLELEQGRSDKQDAMKLAMADKEEARRLAYQQQQDMARLTASLRPAPQEPLMPVKQEDGSVIYAPRSQAAGKVVGSASTTDKPLTEFQAKDVGYGTRAQDADKIFNEIGTNYSAAKLNTANATENLGVVGWAANSALGENEQKVGQAQRNFINATLRQESGATIQPSEFANAKKQYFPQVGDSPAVIKQKAENRARVINSFKIGAGTQGAKHFDETKDPLGLR